MAELRERLEKLELPEEAEKAAMRELGRLERLPAAAAEYGVIRTYLDWIATLPWGATTTDNLDLAHARAVLDEDHYDLEKVKDRIIEHLAVSKLRNDPTGQILCFVGPPGVGKTSLGESIARTLGRRFSRLSVGGVRDEAEMRGHRRTYIGAMPGSIIRALRDAESMNPLFLIDEIDKLGSDVRGDPASAMLEVLDPEQNSDVPRSLSRRAVRPVEGAVHLHREHRRHDSGPAARPHGGDLALRLHRGGEARDRAAVSRPEADRGARSHAAAAAIGVERAAPVIREYTREAGVRELERRIADLCRKTARRSPRASTERSCRRRGRPHGPRPAHVLQRGAAPHGRPRCCDRPCVHRGGR